ncbi:MAG: hypothetical protein HY863_08200 [Chloroflexi bacterium]|nr:hypothetical protein [Chloroflexota bacterium]
MKHNIFIMIALALTLTACSPAADVQIQASETALVSTMIVGMMSAIPPTSTLTNTPVPSETPLPTSTETPISTIEVSPTPLVDPCNGPLFSNPVAAPDAGKVDNGASVLIKNTTKASITVSLYLSKNKFGQCGFVSYVIAPSQSVSVVNELPYGCYSAFAYINDPKKPSTASGGPACITGPDKTTFTVFADKIKITGP